MELDDTTCKIVKDPAELLGNSTDCKNDKLQGPTCLNLPCHANAIYNITDQEHLQARASASRAGGRAASGQAVGVEAAGAGAAVNEGKWLWQTQFETVPVFTRRP